MAQNKSNRTIQESEGEVPLVYSNESVDDGPNNGYSLDKAREGEASPENVVNPESHEIYLRDETIKQTTVALNRALG